MSHVRARKAFREVYPDEEDDPETAITEVLVDMRHLAHLLNLSFEELLLVSQRHFQREIPENPMAPAP